MPHLEQLSFFTFLEAKTGNSSTRLVKSGVGWRRPLEKKEHSPFSSSEHPILLPTDPQKLIKKLWSFYKEIP